MKDDVHKDLASVPPWVAFRYASAWLPFGFFTRSPKERGTELRKADNGREWTDELRKADNGRAWTDEQRDTVRRMYPTHTAAEIAQMIGRSENAVRTAANKLRVRKTGNLLYDQEIHVKKKKCNICEKFKTIAEFPVRKRKSGEYSQSKCKDCEKEWKRTWNKKQAKKVYTPYAEWSEEKRRLHIDRKERARRKSGAKRMSDLREERERRKQQRSTEKTAQKAEREALRKVPAGLTEAEKWKWRYANDAEFREKEKERTRRRKAQVPYWYSNQQLGGNSNRQYPAELVMAKQVQLKVKRYLKEQNNEKH